MTVPLSSADPVRLGGYELLARLGSGGQGVVYLARPLAVPGQETVPGQGAASGRESSTGQGTAAGHEAASGQDTARGRVAIKLLHAQMTANRNARARFVRELSLLQRVAGFCTAQVIEADLAGDQPYIVSEYVPGPSLRELVHEQGPRAGADLDRLAISSVTALAAIHRAGIVHRDFKPQNVLMGSDGPRVIDFGIARALDPQATVTNQIVGTPAYMAPEQFTGTGIGPSADLFAWAATLLFAATGRDPFAAGSVPATMYQIMHHEPDLSVLPDQIAAVAADSLKKDPAARPSAQEVLLRLLGDRTSPHRPTPTQVVPPGRLPASTDAPGNGSTGGAAGVAPATWQEQPHQAGPGHGTVLPGASPTRESGPPPGVHPAPGGPGLGGPAEPRTEPVPWQQGPGQGPPPRGAASAGPDPAGRDIEPFRTGLHPGLHDAGPAGGRPARGLRRGVPAVSGLALATLLAALDVLSLAIFVARPDLTSGSGGGWLLVVASSFVLLAIVTLVGVVLALRGSRAAAWTVLSVRVVRVPLWGLWTLVPDVEWSVAPIAGYATVTALMVVLLTVGLRSR